MYLGITFEDKISKKLTYLVMWENWGFYSFYLSSKDNFDTWLKYGDTNEDIIIDIQDKTYVDSFGKISLEGDYYLLFEEIYQNKLENTKEGKLLRFCTLLMREDYQEMKKFMDESVNKTIDEITLAETSDIEQEYLDDNADFLN